MKFKSLSVLAVTGLALLSIGLPSLAAAPSLTLTLGGKPITSVPVDQLGDVMVTLNTGGQTFKQVYAGQWGDSIDQAQTLFGVIYERAGTTPNLENAANWPNYDFVLSSQDSTWANKTTLTVPMSKAARSNGLQLFKANDRYNVMLTSRFYRKVYTGKTVWKDGGWVKETRWETVGSNLGSAVLKLEPPTFAGSLVPSQLFASSLEAYNAPPENASSNNRAMEFSRWLLYPTSYGGREVKFDGSKITAFEAASGTPLFSWNYDPNSGAPMVYASLPMNMKIHSVMNTKYDSIPLPIKTEADFICPVDMSVSRLLSDGSWKTSNLYLDNEGRKKCRTADGKTADDIVKSANPLENASSPQDLIKGLGF